MNLQVTGEQLRDALITATELRGRIFIRGTVGADGAYGSEHWSEDQIEDLRTILTVLATLADDSTDAGEDPAPAHGVLEAASDDWQPTSIDDITMTDESVLALYADGTGVQGKPHNTTDDTPDSLCITVSDQLVYVSRQDVTEGRVWLYRIPAPIVHPDPEQHPVIIDSGTAWTWNAHQEMYHQPGTREYRSPGGFTSWGPAVITSLEPMEAEVPHG